MVYGWVCWYRLEIRRQGRHLILTKTKFFKQPNKPKNPKSAVSQKLCSRDVFLGGLGAPPSKGVVNRSIWAQRP